MPGKLLPDDLREEIALLFPVHEVSPEGEIRPIPYRLVATAILSALKTGIAWLRQFRQLAARWERKESNHLAFTPTRSVYQLLSNTSKPVLPVGSKAEF